MEKNDQIKCNISTVNNYIKKHLEIKNFSLKKLIDEFKKDHAKRFTNIQLEGANKILQPLSPRLKI